MADVIDFANWKRESSQALIDVLERQLTEALHKGDRVNSGILHAQLLEEYTKLYNQPQAN